MRKQIEEMVRNLRLDEVDDVHIRCSENSTTIRVVIEGLTISYTEKNNNG